MNAATPGTEIPNLRDETLEKIVWYDPEELDFYALNERDHSDAEIDSFQRTIHEYNGAQPVVVDDDGNIIAGRGRVEAGYLLCVDDVPALPLSALTADDVQHYIDTVIRFGKYVGWTREMLEIDLQHLLNIDVLMRAAADDTASSIN